MKLPRNLSGNDHDDGIKMTCLQWGQLDFLPANFGCALSLCAHEGHDQEIRRSAINAPRGAAVGRTLPDGLDGETGRVHPCAGLAAEVAQGGATRIGLAG